MMLCNSNYVNVFETRQYFVFRKGALEYTKTLYFWIGKVWLSSYLY